MKRKQSSRLDKLSSLTDIYVSQKGELVEFLMRGPQIFNKYDTKRLRELEHRVESSFDEFVRFGVMDIELSLQKLDFIVEEFILDADISTFVTDALKSTLQDIRRNVHEQLPGHIRERRQSDRTPKNQFGTFFSENWRTCACLIKDVSKQGVCLIVQDDSLVSKSFKFTGLSDKGVVDASQVWRSGNEIGARIVKCTPTREAWWT